MMGLPPLAPRSIGGSVRNHIAANAFLFTATPVGAP
jgi:hypothetical protein